MGNGQNVLDPMKTNDINHTTFVFLSRSLFLYRHKFLYDIR